MNQSEPSRRRARRSQIDNPNRAAGELGEAKSEILKTNTLLNNQYESNYSRAKEAGNGKIHGYA